FARDLAALTGELRRAPVAEVLARTPRASRSVERLVDGVSPNLRPLLTNLVTGGQSVSARVPALRQLLIGYPAAVAGAFTVVQPDGLHFGLDLNLNVPPPCTRGYERVRRRYPQDVRVARADLHTSCREPAGSETGVRGSRNVPPPLSAVTIPGLDPWLAGYDPATGRGRGVQR
ncbi:MAG: ABC transporter substrate-binding protein, partial [Nonomuraea sp.]|nr:ABC transporter substrate-binding protein [Nonomuraea sp.]